MTDKKPMPDEIYAWMGMQDNGSWDDKPCPCCESVLYRRADLTANDTDEGVTDEHNNTI